MSHKRQLSFTNLLAGLAAGAAGAALMNAYWAAVKKLSAPQTGQQQNQQSQQEPTTNKVAADLLRKVGVEPGRELRDTGGQVVHYSVGATWGAIAGLSHGLNVPLDVFGGAAFGAAVWALDDVWLVYKTGYAKHPREYSLTVHAQSLGAHLVYGFGVWSTLKALHQLSETEMASRIKLPKVA